MFIKKKRLGLYIAIILFFVIFFGSAYHERNKMLSAYQLGIDKIHSHEYQEAQRILGELGDYKDSLDYIELAEKNIAYEEAITLFNHGNYEESIALFEQLGDFQESQKYIEDATHLITQITNQEKKYTDALNDYHSHNYILALQKFSELGDYKDSQNKLSECKVSLARLQRATTISAGIRYSIGIINNGKIEYSGDYLPLEDAFSTWEDIISLSIKGHLGIGLKNDGTVLVAGEIPGYPDYYIDTSTWENIIAVSSGQQYIVGLKADGTLVAQGHNGDGQANISDWSDIIAISTGWRHTVGLDSNGNIHITGHDSEKQLEHIQNHKEQWHDIVAVSAGGGSKSELGNLAYTVALRQDGTVTTTHTGSIAEEINNWTNIVAISAGDFHTVGLKSDGTVVATQTGDSAKAISEWTDIVAVSAGYGFTLGLKSDGTVVATGFDKNNQIDTDDWNNIMTYEEEWNSIFDENLK